MGVTIRSTNYSIDLGYFGFRKLRVKIAELTEEDIAEHYKELENSIFIFPEAKRKKYFEKYDAKIAELDKKYELKYNHILNFLYSDDCEAEIPVKTCKALYELIKDYDDDIAYGYIAREDCAKFKDFKNLVKDCIDNNEEMEWF